MFEHEGKPLEGNVCHVLSVTENTSLLPIGMEVYEMGLMSCLKSRVIPKNREYAETLVSRAGLSLSDPIGIIKNCKGFSLNECYWVVGLCVSNVKKDR